MTTERTWLRLGGALALLAAFCALVTVPRAADAAEKIVPPRVEVVSLLVLGRAGEGRQKFRVGLSIDNRNSEALALAGVNFTLRLGSEGQINVKAGTTATIDALDRKTVELDVDSDIVSSLSRLLAVVKGPKNTLPYEIYGNLLLNKRFKNTLPFSYAGDVPLTIAAERE